MTDLQRPQSTPVSRLVSRVSTWLDQKFGWDKLPSVLGLPVILGLRVVLRDKNLHDTGNVTKDQRPPLTDGRESYATARTADGTYNDVDYPIMGSVGVRFGRNVPIHLTFPEPREAMMEPSPRVVSQELLARDTFKPATTLNLLAAAWLQFMVHDWMSHGKNEPDDPWLVPTPENDDWYERPMRILRTRLDRTRRPSEAHLPPTYVNTETHWWDGSQIYGSDKAAQDKIRSGVDGKLNIGKDGLLPADSTTNIDITGVSGNWWTGLSLLHALFTQEHNAICDRLKQEYPSWSDKDLFDRARLINAALMAKIHTVEWSPAIIAHPTTVYGLKANWWGLEQEWFTRIFGRLTHSDILSGIPGSPTDHNGVPYGLTEEFIAVYRMHPLIPDEIVFRSLVTDEVIHTAPFAEASFRNGRAPFQHASVEDALYSFGTSHPGAITLHNFPNFLRRFPEPGVDGVFNDLASIDILRSRERGVPRYNEFRRRLSRKPIERFEDLTDNLAWAEQIKGVYGGDIERVDTTVGLFAEPLPAGFGFSDTAFRIFLLMASRRLKSDRFFTVDFTPKVYTQTGMEWLADTDMSTVLLRHYPHLRPMLRGVQNAFAPWSPVRPR